MSLMTIVREIGLVKKPIQIEQHDVDQEFYSEYAKVAQKLGIAVSRPSTSIVGPQILAEEMIHVFDTARVEKYMDTKGRWRWYPMRSYQQDFVQIERVSKHSWSSLYGSSDTKVYNKPIPLPALLTAERLIDRCGPSVRFLIAAIDDNPDPFMAVTFSDSPEKLYVIERWDEPSFRG